MATSNETAGNGSRERRYWAFISYSHRDERWAVWLHRKLETYRIPKRLVGMVNHRGEPVPRRLFPVFRDRDELEGAASLSDRIQEGLKQSRFLLIICSPASARSRWVEEEIRTFRRLNGDADVLALVVSGEPNASDSGNPDDECFPSGLRFRAADDGTLTPDRAEPLAADARDEGDGKRGALLKIVAAIAGLRYDDLRQRDAQRRVRVMALSSAVLATVALIMAGLAVYALFQERSAIAARLATESRFEADKHYDLSLLLANEAVYVRDTFQTRSALLSAVLKQPQRAAQFSFHRSEVYALAFGPDGRMLATGGDDGTVALWDVTSGRRNSVPPLQLAGEVTSLAFSPDGTLLAVGNRGRSTPDMLNPGEITYWDVATGQRKLGPFPYDETAWALRFTPDGTGLLAADGDGRATLWRVGKSEPEWASTRVNEFAGFDVALDMRGNWLAVGSEDRRLWLLSLHEREKVLDLPMLHSGAVRGIAFSPDGETLASADSSGKVVLWNLAHRQSREDPAAAGIAQVTRMAYSPDGKRLALGARDGTVLLWDTEARKPRELVLTGRGEGVTSVVFSPNGMQLAVGLKSGLVLLADLRDGERLVRRQSLEGSGWDVATTRDGGVLVATEEGLHDVEIDSSRARPDKRLAPGFFWSVVNARDGSTYAAIRTCQDAHDPLKEVILSDASEASGQPRVVSQCLVDNETLALSPDGNALAIGKLDGTVDLRLRSDNWAARSMLGQPATHVRAIDAIVFSPDGALLALGRRNGLVELWKTADHALARSWQAHSSGVAALAFSADGKLLATGGFDRSVKLWDAASAQSFGKTLQMAEDVNAVAFSPDGRLLAAIGGGDAVLLWDVSTLQAFGEPLKADRGLDKIGHVRALAFTRDGRFLVTVGTDGQLFRWDLRLATLLRQACYSANRTLTQEEWNLYGSWWGRRDCNEGRAE